MSDICIRTYVFKKGFLGGKSTLIITSDFYTRQKPDKKTKEFHYGVDLRCPTGTQITCPVDKAKIYFTGTGGLGGQRVCIEYTNGHSKFFIWFMHLHTKEFTNADKGREITLGTLIGTTGGDPNVDPKELCGTYSTGPHLHLEIRRNSNKSASAVDPKVYWLGQHTIQLKQNNNTLLPYNSNGYVGGTNAFYASGANLYFCEEDLLTAAAVKSGASVSDGSVVEVYTGSNNETEYDKPTRKTRWSEAQERLALGIWQITKMVMDSSVQDKQLCDSSISIQTGSILNFFNKVCQQPFVEFSGDTFGNQYYWLIRRPPFDRAGFKRMIETATLITGEDIISMQTQYEANAIYSWYRIVPTGDVLGVSEQMFLAPAVFFPEYAAIWGSKPLDVQSIYYNYVYSGLFNAEKNKQKLANNNRIIRNVVTDFKYMIESNAYRPFSKCGTVTLKGNRKLKRGTMVMFEDGQVYHIDSVSHSFAISMNSVTNTTTLQLSHGIYANFIDTQKTDNFGKVSYFDLIDWGEDFKIEDITSENYKDKISQWKVNNDCLIFFLSKFHVDGSMIKS